MTEDLRKASSDSRRFYGARKAIGNVLGLFKLGNTTDEIQTPGASLPAVDYLLREAKPYADFLELESIFAASKFISSLGLNKNSKVASIGAGEPNDFFWPGTIISEKYRLGGHALPIAETGWERLIYDTGAQVHIFEPTKDRRDSWLLINSHLSATGSHGLVIPVGGSSYFEYSGLAPHSLDLVVSMNLFGTPMLLANKGQRDAITREIARVMKDGGYWISGDTWNHDQAISDEQLRYLISLGCSVEKMAQFTEARTKWYAIKLSQNGNS